MNRKLSILALAVTAASASMFFTSKLATAAPITGAYDTRTIDGSETTPGNDPLGPWVLTSTDSSQLASPLHQ